MKPEQAAEVLETLELLKAALDGSETMVRSFKTAILTAMLENMTWEALYPDGVPQTDSLDERNARAVQFIQTLEGKTPDELVKILVRMVRDHQRYG